MAQALSIKDTRNRLAEVVNQVAAAGEVFVITKFGKPKAMIVPIPNKTLKSISGIEESFGSWRKRSDIKETNTWVIRLRTKMSKRE